MCVQKIIIGIAGITTFIAMQLPFNPKFYTGERSNFYIYLTFRFSVWERKSPRTSGSASFWKFWIRPSEPTPL